MRRLQPQFSRASRIARTALVAFVLCAIGGVMLVMGGAWMPYVIGGGFALFGLLCAYSAIHQLFAIRTPEMTVECDAETLVRGREVRFTFRQPGPASFESLRANLVGEERWFTHRRGKRIRHVLQLGTFNLYDSGPFEAPFEDTVIVEVPDLPHASDPQHGVDWRLEVWGKVRGRADVQQVFPLHVSPREVHSSDRRAPRAVPDADSRSPR